MYRSVIFLNKFTSLFIVSLPAIEQKFHKSGKFVCLGHCCIPSTQSSAWPELALRTHLRKEGGWREQVGAEEGGEKH